MVASLPLRERGLKYEVESGMWDGVLVAPFAGAWIEIKINGKGTVNCWSLPLRERGLK